MTATAAVPLTITKPGVYDIPAEDYHRDPVPGGSLSSSGARKLLAPSCPALYRYEQDNPPAARKTFEIGHAAHALALGTGPELVLVNHEKWNTNAVKAEVAEIRERGAVPLKREEYERLHAMAAKLREHPMASKLLDPDRGRAEQALIWQDDAAGIWRRALVDWLPGLGNGRPLLVDYKTTTSADPRAIDKTVHNYGYGHQAAWYLDGAIALGYPADTAFLFIFQEKTAPYLITIAQIEDDALDIARAGNRLAIEIYRDCAATGIWPGYPAEVHQVSMPAWALARELEAVR